MDKQTQNLKKSPERLFVLLQEKTKTQVLGLSDTAITIRVLTYGNRIW